MDRQVTVGCPVDAVFAHVADPGRLGDWLPEVTVRAAPPDASGVFTLTVEPGGQRADGEVTAYEPPWLVGYRLFIGSCATSLRLTCVAHGDGTRIEVHQVAGTELAVDLDRLARILERSPASETQRTERESGQ